MPQPPKRNDQSLKDQLKSWKTDRAQQEAAENARADEERRKRVSKSAPARPAPSRSGRELPRSEPRTLRRDDPTPSTPSRAAPVDDVMLQDDELFAQAVARVDREAVLKKYEATPDEPSSRGTRPGRGRGAPAPSVDDATLFAQFVGRVNGAQDGESSRGPPPLAPDDALDVAGIPVEQLARRVRAFVAQAVSRGCARVLLTHVDDLRDSVVRDVLERHDGVRAVRDAPARLGGSQARVVTLL